MRFAILTALNATLLASTVSAQSLEDLKKFDRNGDDRVNVGVELDIYLMHKASATMAKYDNAPIDGKLNEGEIKKIYADARPKEVADRADFIRESYRQRAEEENGIALVDLVGQEKAPKVDPCDGQRGLYIRRNKADISVYNRNISKSLAEGASVSFVHNNLTGSDSADINGVVSYVLARDPCALPSSGVGPEDSFVSGYAVAPSLALNGKVSDGANDKNTARAGLDMQVEFSGGLFDLQYLTIQPFYQSDFDLDASAYGVNAIWEPVDLDLRLGGAIKQSSGFFDYFWQFQLEADALRVEDPGNTNLKADTEYVWLGGTAKLNAYLFPNLFDDRLYATASYQYYWDAVRDRDISNYDLELGFNLTEDGSTSISIEYMDGTEKKSLEKTDQIKVNLNYKL